RLRRNALIRLLQRQQSSPLGLSKRLRNLAERSENKIAVLVCYERYLVSPDHDCPCSHCLHAFRTQGGVWQRECRAAETAMQAMGLEQEEIFCTTEQGQVQKAYDGRARC